MVIIRKQVSELTSVEYRACYNACFNFENGYMKFELDRCRSGRFPGEVIMLWDGPADNTASLIGWCMVTPVRLYGPLAVTKYVTTKSKVTAMFWVKNKYRGQGYGTILMNEVKKIDPNPHVMPHDERSGNLFGKFKCQVLMDDKIHMVKKPHVA